MPTLDHEEHERVINTVVEQAAGRIKVMAGTGSNSTREAIRLTRAASRAGADGALMVGPYYNKPTQEGYYRHFAAVADACDIPIILYNIPGRTASNILPGNHRAARGNSDRGGDQGGDRLDGSGVAHRLTVRPYAAQRRRQPDAAVIKHRRRGVVSVVGNLVPRDLKAVMGDEADAPTKR